MSNASPFRLDGQVALVTGGSRGIGLAIAKTFAAAGASVVISGRKQEALDVAAKEVEAAGGGKCVGVACHAGDIAAQEGLVKATVEHFGRLDVLVCNAATNPVFGPVLVIDEAAYDKLMTVNLKGPFFLAKAAFEVMSAQGGGSIVMLSSIGGLRPEGMLGIYSVSKAALIGLTRVLAKEWGPAGVRVNAICPGVVDTKFAKALTTNEEIMKQVADHTPLGGISEPEDVAQTALYLATDASRRVTGTTAIVDGGMLL